MKTVKVKVKCTICKKFEIEHEIDVNEYGYFSISDAYCPECFALLIQNIDHHKKEE